MRNQTLQLIVPAVAPVHQSEAEIFGAVVWLYMQSEKHQGMPVNELNKLVLPPLHRGQFVLATENQGEHTRPVGFMSWANFNAEAEARYIKTLNDTLTVDDWNSGDRPWIVHYFAPFGHAAQFRSAIQHILPKARFRALYHRGDELGLRVLFFRGENVSQQEELDWWSSRPLP